MQTDLWQSSVPVRLWVRDAAQLHHVYIPAGSGWSPVICHLTGTKAFCTNLNSWLSTVWSVPICVEWEGAVCYIYGPFLSVTAGLHRYLQKETIDIAQAVTYKIAVIDTMKQKRSDTTSADLYSRTKTMCEANQIAVLESSSGQRRKTKRMDEYVVE